MNLLTNFKPKLLAVMLVACAAIAGITAWLFELNFWMLAGFLVGGVLINGLVTTVEDRDFNESEK